MGHLESRLCQVQRPPWVQTARLNLAVQRAHTGLAAGLAGVAAGDAGLGLLGLGLGLARAVAAGGSWCGQGGGSFGPRRGAGHLAALLYETRLGYGIPPSIQFVGMFNVSWDDEDILSL